MALAERADLVARLTLDDKFSGRLGAATARLKGMEGSMSRIAGHANRGLKTAATSLAKIGAVGAGFVALNVRSGIQSLAELEDATVSVDGAIKQMGLTGRLTSQQVAGWANEIESDVQAAFDDKEITQAATTLLRFGKVTDQNLRPAMVVMTDLAAKTGDVDSAATLLAKALADPEKAAGRLTRQGIILTKAEQDQIKALVDAGKAGEAQALVLKSVERATKGAAAAAKGPYNDALNTLSDVTEDAQRALGEAFLPLLQRVAKFLSTELAKPATIEKLRSFGRDLAGGFEKAIEVGKNIPWGLIGDSLQTAGKGAKAIFDAFTMLPPWIQQAVITGWGLNKLTGGALGGIVGELGKGLIKGVLGMTAGVVNLKAGVVNGAGGAAAGAGGSGVGAAVGGAIIGGAVIQGAMDVGTIATGFQRGYQASQQGDVRGILSAQRDILSETVMLPPGLRELGALFTNEQQKVLSELQGTINVKPTGMSPDERQEANDQKSRLRALAGKLQEAKVAQIIASERSRSAIVSAERSGTSAIVGAIRAIQRPIVSVSVVGNTVRTVYRTGGTVTRNVSYGSMQAGLSG